MDEVDVLTLPRRTERPSMLTEKMLDYQKEELSKREKRLLSLYEQWKIPIRISRENVKKDISEAELATMADNIEKAMDDVMNANNKIRERATPCTELRRRIDARL